MKKPGIQYIPAGGGTIVVLFNPCHDERGRFCSTSGGGLAPGRNFTDEEIRQKIRDSKLRSLVSDDAQLEDDLKGMSFEDKLYFMEHYHQEVEFGLRRPSYEIKEKFGNLPLDELRAALEKGGYVTDPNDKTSTPLRGRALKVDEILRGMTEAEKNEFIERYPQIVKNIVDTGGFPPRLNKESFTKAQLERLADGFDAVKKLSYTDMRSRFFDAAEDVALYSANKDLALTALLRSWGMRGSGLPEQQIIQSIAERTFPENQGIQFFKFQKFEYGERAITENDFSRDRLSSHISALKSETESYYREKYGAKYDKATVTLYRGIGVGVTTYTPSAAESWTADLNTAKRFGKMMSDGGPYAVLKTTVPVSGLLWTYESAAGKYGWWAEEDLKGKKEHVVLGGVIKNVEIKRYR